MADNITIPPTGSGTATPVVSTDDIGGFHHQRVKLGLGADGTAITASADDGTTDTGTLRVTQANDVNVNTLFPGVIDPNNTSVVALGGAAVFTGTGTDVLIYGSVSIFVFADQNSATDGLSIELSSDGTNWDIQDQHSIIANQAEVFILPRGSQFFRVVYTNGGVAQGAFRLESILNPWGVSGEIEELDVDIDAKDLALTTRSIIAGETPGGTFTNVQVSAGGNFKVDVEDVGGNSIDVGSGVDGTGTQRVALVTDVGLPTGSNIIGALTANQSINTVQLGGVAISLDTGARDTGTQRVTVATDDLVPISAASLPLPTGASTLAAQLPDGHNVTVDNASLAVTDAITGGWDNAASDGASVSGDTAHDTADAGEPVKLGNKAIDLGADPTEVAALDRTDWYANRAGIPFVLGGHMNIITREWRADGAFTDDDICEAVDASHKLVVTCIAIMVDAAASTDPDVRVGFGTANVPSEPASGASVAGIVTSHSAIAAGSGVVIGDGSGIVGIGALNEELRATVTTPTVGSIRIVTKYFLIAG